MMIELMDYMKNLFIFEASRSADSQSRITE